MPLKLPAYIAHRGLSAYAPENTLEAFELARLQSYSMFECDVQLTKEGVPVIVHDDIKGFRAKAMSGFPSLQAVLAWMSRNTMLMNLELKGLQENLCLEIEKVLKPYLSILKERIN